MNTPKPIKSLDELIEAKLKEIVDEAQVVSHYDEALDEAVNKLRALINKSYISRKVVEEAIGDDDPVSGVELPDENGQVKGTWATHRNKLRAEQRAELRKKLGIQESE